MNSIAFLLLDFKFISETILLFSRKATSQLSDLLIMLPSP